MKNKKDYYNILNINKNASEQEIKNAFRKLSRLHHPDIHVDKSDIEKIEHEEKFKLIAEAYDILSNKDKREKYDRFGHDGLKMNNQYGFSGFSGFDINDFMAKHASMFGNFGMPFGFNDENTNTEQKPPNFDYPENGSDIKTTIELTFKEAVNGCEKTLNLKLPKECPECKGTGIDHNIKPELCTKCSGKGQIVNVIQNGYYMMSRSIMDCPSCHGTGYTVKHCKKCHGQKRILDVKYISFKIPGGIDENKKVIVRGKGECGIKGGEDGNLYVFIKIKNQNIFERNGINVKTKVYIDPITAAIGGKISVPTPYKIIDIDIPAETISGKIINIKNEGIKTDKSVGDLFVEIYIESYSKLNNEQKKLLEDLKNKFTIDNFPIYKKYLNDAKQFIF